MAKSLSMTFLNEEGKKSSITLNNVKEDVTEAEVKAAMDVILVKNIFSKQKLPVSVTTPRVLFKNLIDVLSIEMISKKLS